MKKKLQLLLMSMLGLCALFVNAQNVPFKVRFSTSAASCYNNGKIHYALTDFGGEVLDSLPEGLSQVRVYHRLSATDTVHYAGWYYNGGTDTLTIGTGIYIVGVEGLMSDGHGGYVRVDTQTVITVVSNYVKPEAFALTQTASGITFAGNLPSLSCQNTGRVQLSILNGAFPYTVTVCDRETGDTLRTQVFPEQQNDGSREFYADYRHYYSFDTMPVGDWDFYLVDGCGYGLPKVNQVVEEATLPKLKFINLFTSSGNFDDTNVVRIQVELDKSADQFPDVFQQYARYRMVYTGLETKEWKPLPITEGQTLELRDTVWAAEKYCDIWGKEIKFEYKLEGCGEWEKSISFCLNEPNDFLFQKDTSNTNTSHYDGNDPCAVLKTWRRNNYSIQYYSDDYAYGVYAPDIAFRVGETPTAYPYYRYFYTHPLTWVYTDTRTGQIIKKDTIDIIINKSYLHDYEVEAIYGSFEDTVLAIPVNRALLDRKGCVLYETLDTMTFYHRQGWLVDGWGITNTENATKCCDVLRHVTVSRSEVWPAPIPSVVRLVRSPDHNRYNFEAVYNPETEIWTITKEHPDNGARVEGLRDGNSVTLSDYCMPGGIYTFEIFTQCDTFTLTKTIKFPNIYLMEMVEEPAYTISRECGTTYVTYTAGKFQRTVLKRSYETDAVDTSRNFFNPRIECIKGFPYHYTPEFSLNTPIRISMNGSYIFKITVGAYDVSYCEAMTWYDTIDFNLETVEFEYAMALLCDSSTHSGHAYVKGVNGSEPYTYTLYSLPDRQGEVLGVNHTGVFNDVPMRSDQQLSCLVEDSCHAYFHVNFYPRTLSAMQKVWFDGGMTTTDACEGTTIQVHALSIGDVLQYDWSGPDGFHATTAEPYVFIPRGGSSGWYRVAITYEDCNQLLTDSIFLSVNEVPSLVIRPDATVCPGDTVEVTLTPNSAEEGDRVNFTVAFAAEREVMTRKYSAMAGTTLTDRFVAFSDTKIFPLQISNGRCDYLSADAADTAYIRVRTDVVRACTVLTTYDTVCAGGNATLTARSTIEAPYSIRWYSDYELTHFLKSDRMGDAEQWSHYDTAGIQQRTVLYAAVEKEGMCPTVNGLPTFEMNMQDGVTLLDCGQVCRLYDAGGPDGNYPLLSESTHRFRSADGRPLVLKFNRMNLSHTSHLLIFTGEEMHPDSLLFDYSRESWNPGVLASRGGSLTLAFRNGADAAAGWEAVVEPMPGMAVAEVWPKHETLIRDEVCQSQTRTYDDPYGVVPEIVPEAEVNEAIRQTGNYYFSKTYFGAGEYGCDSTVTFELSVNPPTLRDTTVVMLSSPEVAFQWRDSLYTESGYYTVLTTRPDGCDSLEVLDLLIVDANVSYEDICQGDVSYLEVETTMPEEVRQSAQLPNRARIGDVLCTDGSVLPSADFSQSGKTAKGVVFYADESGTHGLAVALTEISSPLVVAMNNSSLLIHATLEDVLWDMDGLMNTKRIRNAVNAATNATFDQHAPAVRYCFNYDHLLLNSGTTPMGWYLPAIGELNLLIVNRLEVNKTLRMLADRNAAVSPMLSSGYWSSSMCGSGKAWIITQSGAISSATIGSTYVARPVILF